MKKLFFGFVVVGLVAVGMGFGALTAQAMTPTVTFSAPSSADSVQVSVYGDTYASVTLYFQRTGYGTQQVYLGTTSSSGYLNTTVSTSIYNITPGSAAYVMVNNQQSASSPWPSGTTTSGSVILSQYSISLAVGQSVSVYVSGGSQPYTMYTVGSPNIFQPALSGNTLMIQALVAGSSSINVCSVGGTACATLSIQVNTTTTTTNQLSLSQTNVTLNVGGSMSISIGGNGGFYISNNSNASSTSSYINGSTLSITGSNAGTNTITVCQNGGQCGTVYVTVNSTTTSATAPITFSQTNPTLTAGQALTISVYGGYGATSFYIPFNSNTSLVQTSLSGSTLTLNASGVSGSNNNVVIVICSSANNCGAITVKIGSTTVNQGNWTYCANEKGWCGFQGTQTIRYGANGVYFYRTFTNGVSCTNTNFGDPIFGVVKQCYYGGTVY